MSKRTKIVNKIISLLKDNLNGIDYQSNIYNNVSNRVIFWDEINNFPHISISAGNEARQYLPANFKWAYLSINIRVYIQDENAYAVLEEFLGDIEAIIDANNNLIYDEDTGDTTELISIISIDTDQGLLEPLAVAEMVLQVQYDV
jgi:hypothetical protein